MTAEVHDEAWWNEFSLKIQIRNTPHAIVDAHFWETVGAEIKWWLNWEKYGEMLLDEALAWEINSSKLTK